MSEAPFVQRETRPGKLGHRRVTEEGTVTYKKKTTSEIQSALQLGITISVGSINNKPKRDMLLKDFGEEELTSIPRAGTRVTPGHQLSDFQFRTYAPKAFRFFRDMFKVDMAEFMDSICTKDLRELSNAGASGSIFYITLDDEFIIKTVQKKEAKFLQKLLPEYYLNLMQHPRTLLPKFYGLYCYETMGKNIRFVIMNNLLPSIKIHEKYDLKGSTFKRFAGKKERAKSSPTLKDLDFKENHPEGLTLDPETYDALMNTFQRDCRVLESFRIMDFSLLLGIHNVDQYRIEKQREKCLSSKKESSPTGDVPTNDEKGGNGGEFNRNIANRSSSHGRSIKRIAAYSTPMESIQPESTHLISDDEDLDDIPSGGIPARNSKGEKLYLYLGIIDILQSYQMNKKLEHTFKSLVHDGETISVTNPTFYKERFEDFFAKTVFKKASTGLMKFKKVGNMVRFVIGLKHTKRRQSRLPESDIIRSNTQKIKSEPTSTTESNQNSQLSVHDSRSSTAQVTSL